MAAKRRPKKVNKKAGRGSLRAEYLAHLRRRNYSPETLNTYRCLLRIYGAWLHLEAFSNERRVTLEDLERFMAWIHTEHGITNAGSRGNFVKALRGFYGFLHKERLILSDPTKDLQHPKIPQRVHQDVLSIPELRKLMASPDMTTPLGVRDAATLRLMGMCGLRISEVSNLLVKHIHLRRREIMVRKGKGQKDRVVFFDHGTRDVFQAYLKSARTALMKAPSPWTVIGEKGHGIGTISIRKIVRDHVKQAGFKKRITPHSLRRTFAVLLLKGGCNLKAIAEIMGHDELSTTAGYVQLDTDSMRDVYNQTHPLGEE